MDIVEDVLSLMQGCKICGKTVSADYYFEERVEKHRRSGKNESKKGKQHSKHSDEKGHKK